MSERSLSSEITYFGQKAILSCDGCCEKAFGWNGRITVPNSLDEDDFEWMADHELPDAPAISKTIEGDDNKPCNRLETHNKWCARECERSVMTEPNDVVVLPNWSERLPNILKYAGR